MVGLNHRIFHRKNLSRLREVFLLITNITLNTMSKSMLSLSRKDTYAVIYFEHKYQGLKRRYKRKTLHKWWCLNCGEEIFVRYDSVAISNIFCNDPDCQEKLKQPSIVQSQYFRRLKEEQLKLFDNIK